MVSYSLKCCKNMRTTLYSYGILVFYKLVYVQLPDKMIVDFNYLSLLLSILAGWIYNNPVDELTYNFPCEKFYF